MTKQGKQISLSSVIHTILILKAASKREREKKRCYLSILDKKERYVHSKCSWWALTIEHCIPIWNTPWQEIYTPRQQYIYSSATLCIFILIITVLLVTVLALPKQLHAHPTHKWEFIIALRKRAWTSIVNWTAREQRAHTLPSRRYVTIAGAVTYLCKWKQNAVAAAP